MSPQAPAAYPQLPHNVESVEQPCCAKEISAPYNFLTIFSDGFIAVWLLVLLYLYYREGGFRKQDQVSGQQRQTPKSPVRVIDSQKRGPTLGPCSLENSRKQHETAINWKPDGICALPDPLEAVAFTRSFWQSESR